MARGEAETDEFRTFRKQLYHASIAHVLAPLKHYMTQYDIIRCPDGHFRRVIYNLGPFIADYPEQVILAGIVTGWCPKYAPPNHIHHGLTQYNVLGAGPRPRGLVSWEPETRAPMSILSKLSEILALKQAGQRGGLTQTSL